MNSSSLQPLFDAVARQAGVVLSLPRQSGLSHHKSRLLEQDDEGLWVRIVGEERWYAELIASGNPIGASFRGGDMRHVFVAPLLRHESAHRMADGRIADALLLAMPTAVKPVQRRASYRVKVSPESELFVRCWRISRRASLRDRPQAAQELLTEVQDVSSGGMGVVFRGKDGHPPKVAVEDRLRIELRHRDVELLMEGRIRPSNLRPDGGLRTGVRFVFLQSGIRDRQTVAKLTTLVGQLQRQEAKYRRLRRAS